MSNILQAYCRPAEYIYNFKLSKELNHKQFNWNSLLSNKKVLILLLSLISISLIFLNLSRNIEKWDLEQILSPFFGFRAPAQGGKETEGIGFLSYQRISWILIASAIAATLLAISGNISQSLLQNPLADSSTLGMMDGAAFGLIILKAFLGASIGNYYWAYFVVSLFFSFIVFSLILFLFNRNPVWERQNFCTMLILFGLVLNIFFRTAVHLIKEYSEVSLKTSFALAMGGAENIYDLFPSQYPLIQIAFPIALILLLSTRLLAKNLNLAELGFDQAFSLGVNVKLLQFIGYLIILCCNTLTINLVGNIAFLGLISTHIARKVLRTRKYEQIIPVSTMISICLLLLAITINSFVPYISSSNLIVALGATFLLFLIKK
ncbi:ABC transporter [Mycoplasma ovis str. Michigan]|uniref:ABC transporter n=1 Tax=Mycoplasma ovis str. Michigan TaxID=1415773 RepID=A0ABN4BPR3_9MOLU|nr:iron chelate uptake ABC transporter family permease subunit [Mycoplasma ovis]AHC39858.1 ABC transporter [Mycoplasma ovis str. Michigan]